MLLFLQKRKKYLRKCLNCISWTVGIAFLTKIWDFICLCLRIMIFLCIIGEPTWHISIRVGIPPWPTMDRVVSMPDVRCWRDRVTFSFAKGISDSNNLIRGRRAPSDTERWSQFSASMRSHMIVAAFSRIYKELMLNSCTRSKILLLPAMAKMFFSSSFIISMRLSRALCLHSMWLIWRRANNSLMFHHTA